MSIEIKWVSGRPQSPKSGLAVLRCTPAQAEVRTMDHRLAQMADLAVGTQACLAPILSQRADGAGAHLVNGEDGDGDEGGGDRRFCRTVIALISLAARPDVEEDPPSTLAF
jgi:hypothetical protein